MLVSCCGAAANLSTEFSFKKGVSENLFGDSTGAYMDYTAASMELSYYPLSSVEISLTGIETYYPELIGLSSGLGGLKVTYIPTSPTSPFSLYFSGNINTIEYHREFERFDNNYGQVEFSAGYNITETASIRSGVSYTSTTYVNSETSYIRDFEFFAGGNITLPWSNSFDLELGMATTNYEHKDVLPIIDSVPPGEQWHVPTLAWELDWIGDQKDQLWTFYFSPRISRSLGSKTGISVIYTQRRFQNYDHYILLGVSTGFLSPWGNIWDGNSVSANLKTYLTPNHIITTGIGYWDKTYLKTVDDQVFFYNKALHETSRQDWQTRFFVNIQWPITGQSGIFWEPTLRIEYTKNESNKTLYVYSNFSFSVGMNFRL